MIIAIGGQVFFFFQPGEFDVKRIIFNSWHAIFFIVNFFVDVRVCIQQESIRKENPI